MTVVALPALLRNMLIGATAGIAVCLVALVVLWLYAGQGLPYEYGPSYVAMCWCGATPDSGPPTITLVPFVGILGLLTKWNVQRLTRSTGPRSARRRWPD